ncbi:MAG: serine--tRNA ligase [Gemmatimonadota bacterium]
MLDIRRLRAAPEEARRSLSRRNDPDVPGLLDQALDLDRRRRQLLEAVERLKAERNRASREIGERKRTGEDAPDLIAAMRGVAEEIRELDARLSGVEERLREVLLRIPNFPDERVPPGEEGEGEVVKEAGEAARRARQVRPHWELTGGESGSLDGAVLDLARGAKVAGSGFPLLVGKGARLARALIDFMLNLHVEEHGYLEVSPPLLVNRDSMRCTGHLPKFEGDAYRTEPDDLFLVPTAEVPLTNLHRDELVDGSRLPLAYVAYTPCFRREAGAAGRDTRGLLRVHQFDKVELVRFAHPERSAEELELLTGHAERVLELLELPYRRVLLPAGDLGFANAITYDLEVWAPGVGEWLEVSSCSSYTDYQARRAGIRFRPAPGASPEFVHTLNGSGVALARTIVALVENGYEPGRGIRLPEALHPYLGFDRIDEPT